MPYNVPQLSDGRISPVTKALDKYTILFRFFKLCSYAPVAKLVLWAAKPSSSLSTSYYPLCSASSASPVYASFANQIIALFSTNSLFIFPFFILKFSFAIFEQTLSFLIEEFDFYAIAYASNDFSIKRFLIAFLKMTFLFLFLSVLRLKSRNKDQPGDVKNGGQVLLRITVAYMKRLAFRSTFLSS